MKVVHKALKLDVEFGRIIKDPWVMKKPDFH